MPVTVGLVTGAVGTGLNLYNSYNERQRAKDQLGQLRNTPMELYSATPELMNYYSRATNDATNPQGLSAGEKAAYNSNVAGNINTVYRNAVNTSGGQLGRYLSNAFNPAIER